MLTKIAIALAVVGTSAAVVLDSDLLSVLDRPNDPPIVQPIPTPPEHPVTNQKALIDVVFVLDSTGSMGGLIQAAKDKIWSIASTMASGQPAPEIRVGIVTYRDRGDAYVTRRIPLSSDLDQIHAELMTIQAAGGGDGPESVNQGLYEAITEMAWHQTDDAYKVVFLVGDAPPHMDYQDDIPYPQSLALASERGIVVNAIQCGDDTSTRTQWNQIAQLAGGRYFSVAADGGAIAAHTPFDERIAKLSAELDASRVYFGSDDARKASEDRMEVASSFHAASPAPSRARRAAFNATESGKSSLMGDNELIEQVASGAVKLEEVPETELPVSLRTLDAVERQQAVKQIAEKRDVINRELDALIGQRKDHLAKEMAAEPEALEASLDYQLFDAIREQSEEKGFSYDEADADY